VITTVLIAALDPPLAGGLEHVLRGHKEMQIVASGEDQMALGRAVHRHSPEVIVVCESVHYEVLGAIRADKPGVGWWYWPPPRPRWRARPYSL
jgi:hypothetical protein